MSIRNEPDANSVRVTRRFIEEAHLLSLKRLDKTDLVEADIEKARKFVQTASRKYQLLMDEVQWNENK